MPDGFMSSTYFHGDSDRVEAYVTEYSQRPGLVLGAGDGTTGVRIHPAPAMGVEQGRFARDLAAAADQYAWDVTGIVGDPQAGADFWASIDTCPDETCGGGS